MGFTSWHVRHALGSGAASWAYRAYFAAAAALAAPVQAAHRLGNRLVLKRSAHDCRSVMVC